MRLHPTTILALSQERVADLRRAAEHERRATRARERSRGASGQALGSSLRLPGGRWVHLRHDSA
jgi:hypothetical protein